MNKKESCGLDAALKIIGQNCKETPMLMEDMKAVTDGIVSTGISDLDNILGIGGLKRGSIVEISGSEGAGKTTLALYLAKQYQSERPILYIDAERTLTKETAERMGVDSSKFYVLHENTLENVLSVCDSVSDTFGAIVIDSFAALHTANREIWQEERGAARVTAGALSILVEKLYKSQTTLFIVNQMREKVGVMFGNPETETGGKALRYYASVRMNIRTTEYLKKRGEMQGIRSRISIKKNKFSAAYKDTEIDIFFDKGIVAN